MAKQAVFLQLTEDLYQHLGEVLAETGLEVHENFDPLPDRRHRWKDRPRRSLSAQRGEIGVSTSRWWNDVDQRYELMLVIIKEDPETRQFLADVIKLLEAHGARLLEKSRP